MRNIHIPNMNEMREWRERLGVTQAEVAKSLGITQSYLAKIELGIANPSYKLISKMVDFYQRLENKSANVETISAKYHKGIEFIGPDEEIGKAASHMKWKGYSQLPVIKDGKCVGSITEEIIVKKMLEINKSELYKAPVRSIMGAPFIEIKEDCSLLVASDMLRYTPMLLVKSADKYVGVITKSDLL